MAFSWYDVSWSIDGVVVRRHTITKKLAQLKKRIVEANQCSPTYTAVFRQNQLKHLMENISDVLCYCIQSRP